MFEKLARGDDLPHVDDAAVIDAITGWTRAAATVEFHRLAAITELTDRRGASEQALERQFWACDAWDSAAAEIAAACGIGARAASTQMRHGLALRYRLPEIAKLLANGDLSARLANAIGWRTQLIDDPDVLAQVDGDLADKAASFGPMSQKTLENAVDAAIAVHDPAAVRRFRTAAKGCDVRFGDADDTTGTTSMWGRLTVTDAELFERRVNQLARGVCPRDPRSAGERRAAALGVLGAGGTELPCTCGRPDCAAAGRDARADAIVVHVLTDHHPDSEPDGRPDTEPDAGPEAGPPPEFDGPAGPPPPDADPDPRPPTDPDVGPPPNPKGEPRPPHTPGPQTETGSTGTAFDPDLDPDLDLDAEPESEPAPLPHSRSATVGLAVIAGGGIVPTFLLSELIALGATVRPVPNATELCTEPRYRPSTTLTRFVRSRDLTCCFPGCERPAERCDLDHTTPHGVGGLTHPGNTKVLCRKHHLLKTFWTGPTGWTDHQLDDGAIVWRSPTGHRYTRPPGSRLLFPHWNTHTPLPPGTDTPRSAGSPERGLTMPTRKNPRGWVRALRLHNERQRNQQAIDEDVPPF